MEKKMTQAEASEHATAVRAAADAKFEAEMKNARREQIAVHALAAILSTGRAILASSSGYCWSRDGCIATKEQGEVVAASAAKMAVQAADALIKELGE